MKHSNPIRRAAALGLALALALSLPAGAAAPTYASDETVYVNLDHYGSVQDIRVVKGVATNGVDWVEDLGDYREVLPMTARLTPEEEAGRLAWNVKDLNSDRFYYECVMDPNQAAELPWTFDVSYQLNGKPVEAMDCAGAEGLVSITIHAIPNAKAPKYYQDNLALMVATGVDMDQTTSIQAPGAQIQAMGNYKMVAFLAMPGAEETFQLQIGSKEFESTGLVMMMVPGTLEQLETIADLRELKDKTEDAEEDMYRSMRELLAMMTGMQGGMRSMQRGLTGVEDVRQQLAAARGTLDPELDEILDSMEELVGDSQALIPSMEQMGTDLKQIQADGGAMVDTVLSGQKDLADYEGLLSELSASLKDLRDLVGDLQDLEDVGRLIDRMGGVLDDLAVDSDRMAEVLKDLRTEQRVYESAKPVLQEAMGNLAEENPALVGELQNLLKEMDQLANLTGKTLRAAEDMMVDMGKMMDEASYLMGVLSELWEVLEEYEDLPYDLIDLGEGLVRELGETLDLMDAMMDALAVLQGTMDQTLDHTTTLLEQSTTLMTSLNRTMAAATQAMRDMTNTLRSVRAQSDESIQATMDGLLDVLEESLAHGSLTGTMDSALSSVHTLLRDELDELEDESNVLNMDPSLPIRSYTSEKNRAPASLQFMLRTEEITLDDLDKQATPEPEDEDIGVWGRIVYIFKELAASVTGVLDRAR